jgi:mannose-6-phosphate isomerase-like protein (cupin superfamily)
MISRVGNAFVLGPGDGRSIPLGNFSMSLKASADDTAGSFSLLEATEPPGFGPPLHIHHQAAEAFYVLDGEYRMWIESREFTCPAGSFVYIPAGMRHGFRVGDVESRKLNLYLPAAMVGYFDELSRAIATGDAEPADLDAIAERAGMEVIGPVPEGYL